MIRIDSCSFSKYSSPDLSSFSSSTSASNSSAPQRNQVRPARGQVRTCAIPCRPKNDSSSHKHLGRSQLPSRSPSPVPSVDQRPPLFLRPWAFAPHGLQVAEQHTKHHRIAEDVLRADGRADHPRRVGQNQSEVSVTSVWDSKPTARTNEFGF